MPRLSPGARALARRPTLAAALLYGVLGLVLIGQSLLPGRTLSTADQLWLTTPWAAEPPPGFEQPATRASIDFPLHYRPSLSYARSELPGAPLWNPHIMAGRPFVGNAQSAVFSPFSLPAFVLPFGVAMGVIAWAKLFVAAMGTFLLARALRMGWSGAALAGLVYAFGLPLVTWLLVAPYSSAWALIPWLLLACERLLARPRMTSVGGLAAVVGAELAAGQPQVAFHALVAGTLFFGFRLARTRREANAGRREWLVPVVGFVGALLWGAAIAAIAMLPFIELLLSSSDIGERGAAFHRVLDREYVAAIGLPFYWGRDAGVAPQARFLYAGALPLMLAAVALLRPTLGRLATAVAGTACLMVVFAVPPAFELANTLPVFSKADNTRMVILFVLCVAVLAGAGLEDLRHGRLGGRLAAAVPVVGVLVVCAPLAWVADTWPSTANLSDALAVAWKLATPPGDVDVVRLASVVLWLTWGVLAIGLLALMARGRRPPALVTAAALVLVCLDLFRAGMGFNPAIPVAHASQPPTGAVRYLQSRLPARFAGTGAALPPNLAMSYGLYDARGYDFPVERRFARLWENVFPLLRAARGVSVAYGLHDVNPGNLRILSLLGVADIIVEPQARRLEQPELRVAYRGRDAIVYANRRALPRAFIVAGQHVVPDEDAALAAILRPGFDPRMTVVSEQPLASLPRSPTPPAGTASIVEATPERIEVQAIAARPGMLVLSDLHYPGWRATVDGRSADLERVDYLLRGVAVAPGTHRVSFVYRPWTWQAGRITTIIALVALALVAVGHRVRSRRAAGA